MDKDGIAMIRQCICKPCRISVLSYEPNVPDIVLAVGYGILRSEVFMNDVRTLVKRAIKSVQSGIQ
jgi:hypothetical protein